MTERGVARVGGYCLAGFFALIAFGFGLMAAETLIALTVDRWFS